ncbi:hypothetical protein ACEXQD_16035 [Herbiconiux sp. P15]|uniref:hypothetical protein n=1 Tax=Herbiconiux liukaitaii TaxID=3342799 RepID=UPI0035BA4920
MASTTSSRTPQANPSGPRRRRRRLLIVLAGIVVIAVIATIVVIRVMTPATGVQAALGSSSFIGCLDREGGPEDEPSVEGAESWSAEQERDFWSHPLALNCASKGLAEDRRQRALSIAFPSRETEGGGSGSSAGGGVGIGEQWQAVADYAVWLEQEGVERDIAMLRLAGLLRGLWVTDADRSNWAQGFCDAAVLSDLRARGELPGYDAWFAESGSELDIDSARALADYSTSDFAQDRPENEQPFRDYLDRSRALLEVVR